MIKRRRRVAMATEPTELERGKMSREKDSLKPIDSICPYTEPTNPIGCVD